MAVTFRRPKFHCPLIPSFPSFRSCTSECPFFRKLSFLERSRCRTTSVIALGGGYKFEIGAGRAPEGHQKLDTILIFGRKERMVGGLVVGFVFEEGEGDFE